MFTTAILIGTSSNFAVRPASKAGGLTNAIFTETLTNTGDDITGVTMCYGRS